MIKFNIPTLTLERVGDINKKLIDQSLDFKLATVEAEVTEGSTVGEITFEVGARGGAEIMLFNHKEDVGKDPSKIIGESSGIRDATDFQLRPQIEFDNDRAWLKYSLSGKIDASGGGKFLKFVDAKVNAEKSIVFDSYRLQDPEKTVGSAIKDDLASFKFVLSKKDVLALKEKEALSVHVLGKLQGSFSVKWSNILSGILGKLSMKVLSNEVVKVEIEDSITGSFRWDITDLFTIVFSRAEDKDGFRVAVLKADRKEIGAKIGLGIDVGLSGNLDEIVKKVKESVIDENLDKVKEILDRINTEKVIDDLNVDALGKGKEILIKLMDRLGLDWVNDKVKMLKEKLDKLEEELSVKKIKEAAETHVKVGLTYDYTRIKKNTTLFQAILSRDAVEKYHSDLISRKLTGVLEDESGQINRERFMNEKIKWTRKAAEFSLGIGKWAFGGKTVKELKEVYEETTDSRKKRSFLGVRQYIDKLGKRTIDSKVDFNAQMNNFSKEEHPMASEFEFGFSFLWKWQWKNKKDILKNLPMVIDHAAIWKAGDLKYGMNGKEVAEKLIKEQLNDKKDIKDIDITHKLKFDHEAFMEMLLRLTKRNKVIFAQALGAAMPYEDRYAIRKFYNLRQMVYAPLWESYFKKVEKNPFKHDNLLLAKEMSKAAWAHIKQLPNEAEYGNKGSLANRERQNKIQEETGDFGPGTIGDLVFKKKINFYWSKFIEGMDLLHKAISADTNNVVEVIKESWKSANEFWDVPFLARAFGVYLLMLSEDISKNDQKTWIWDHIERSLEISYTKIKDGREVRETSIITKAL